jgi:hypothetical protein
MNPMKRGSINQIEYDVEVDFWENQRYKPLQGGNCKKKKKKKNRNETSCKYK